MTDEEREKEPAFAERYAQFWDSTRRDVQRCAVCGVVNASNAYVRFRTEFNQWLCMRHWVEALNLRDRLAGTDRQFNAREYWPNGTKGTAVPSTPTGTVPSKAGVP